MGRTEPFQTTRDCEILTFFKQPSASALTKEPGPWEQGRESILPSMETGTPKSTRGPGAGYRVDRRGRTGWMEAPDSEVDLLITDNEMPKRTGLKLMKRLRSVGKSLPVILASRYWSVDDAQRSPRLGAAAEIMKPFTPAELLQTVRDLLRATIVRNRDDRFFPRLAEVLAHIQPVSHWGINE